MRRDYAQFDPFWLEEPVAPLDYEGHRLLRAELPYAIATGENLYTHDGFCPLLDQDACDCVMPDDARCGVLGAVKPSLAELYPAPTSSAVR